MFALVVHRCDHPQELSGHLLDLGVLDGALARLRLVQNSMQFLLQVLLLHLLLVRVLADGLCSFVATSGGQRSEFATLLNQFVVGPFLD